MLEIITFPLPTTYYLIFTQTNLLPLCLRPISHLRPQHLKKCKTKAFPTKTSNTDQFLKGRSKEVKDLAMFDKDTKTSKLQKKIRVFVICSQI